MSASGERSRTTRLSRSLHGGRDEARTGPLMAFDISRKTFIAGERVDMQGLAATLGVDRATLFRWVGNRDQLLGEVIWSVAEPTLRRAFDVAEGEGATRVSEAIAGFVVAVTEAEFFSAYLRRERDRALRLLTTQASSFQHRLIKAFEDLLVKEVATGTTYPLPVHDLAYVIARICESFIYSDLITGEPPNPDKAALAIAALLGVVRDKPHSAASETNGEVRS